MRVWKENLFSESDSSESCQGSDERDDLEMEQVQQLHFIVTDKGMFLHQFLAEGKIKKINQSIKFYDFTTKNAWRHWNTFAA